MKNFKPLLVAAGVSFITLLSGCNGGVNMEIPGAPVVDPNAVTNPDPYPTPTATPSPGTTPTPSPTPVATPTPNPTTGKNRIFVSTALVTAINTCKETYFDSVCNDEARRAKLPGNFAALVATSKGTFAKNHSVKGYIYQKSGGAEIRVADSLQALLAGNNEGVYTTAYQQTISNSYKNFAWTGQNNFNQPASPDLNCADWSTDHGYGIVGHVGSTGSDALASQYQGCHIIAHLYCIETN